MPALLARMERERNRKRELLGLPTGLAAMDALTRGFQPGEIIVAGSRSGIGKSSLMCQAAAANCRQGHPGTAFLSGNEQAATTPPFAR